MKLKIDKKDLKKALDIVKPAVATKEVLAQTTSFVFDDGMLSAFNDDIGIVHPVEGLDFTGAVKAKELSALVGSLNLGDVDIEISDNSFTVKQGRLNAKIVMEARIKLPMDELVYEGKWRKLPEGFVEAIVEASTVCGSTSLFAFLSCVHIQKNGVILATDQISAIRLDVGNIGVKDFLIPSSTASVIKKINPIEIGESSGWIHFKTSEGTELHCRTQVDEFPRKEVERSFKTSEGSINIPVPKGMSAGIDKVSVFTDNIDGGVLIKVANRRMILIGKSSVGTCKEVLDSEYKGDAVQFEVDPVIIYRILKKKVESFEMNDNRLLFVGEDWEFVISLINRG